MSNELIITPPSEVAPPKRKRPGGRVSKKTRDTLAVIAQAIDAGGTITDAAKAAGIGRKSLYEWMNEDESVREVIEHAKLARRSRLLKRIEEASSESWQAAAWILERTMPEEFSKNATVTVQADIAGPTLNLTKVEVNADPDRIADVLARLALSGALPVAGAAALVGDGDDAEDDEVRPAGSDTAPDGVSAA